MKVAAVVGSRPDFVRAAPVSALLRRKHKEVLIHAGEREDDTLSAPFLRSLRIPVPDLTLAVAPGTHAEQTAAMLIAMERAFEAQDPDVVLAYGDTNAAMAAALAAANARLPLSRVEAGVRSHNRGMPEEVHRVVADHLASLLFCPTQTAVENLAAEGIRAGVHLVGDVMYDVALASAQEARRRDVVSRLGLRQKGYLLCTVHRRSNTEDPRHLGGIVAALNAAGMPVLFPVHPRTRKALEAHGLFEGLGEDVRAVGPMDYLDFQAALMSAAKVLTDSGGVQKEAYFFGVPCITLRDETEWIETVEDGWNVLVGSSKADILRAVSGFNPGGTKAKSFGDGHAAERIVDILTGIR